MTNQNDKKRTAVDLAAQCWCDPRTSDKIMDSELAYVIADTIQTAMDQAREEGRREERERCRNIARSYAQEQDWDADTAVAISGEIDNSRAECDEPEPS